MEYKYVNGDRLINFTDLRLIISGMLCLDFYIVRQTLLYQLKYAPENLDYKDHAGVLKDVAYFTEPGSSYLPGGYTESILIDGVDWTVVMSDDKDVTFLMDPNDDSTSLSINIEDGIISIIKKVDGIETFNQTYLYPFNDVDKDNWLSSKVGFLMSMAECNQELNNLLQLHTSSLDPHELTREVISNLSDIQSAINSVDIKSDGYLLRHTPSKRIIGIDNRTDISLPIAEVIDSELIIGGTVL